MFNVNKSKVGKEKNISKLRPNISLESKIEAMPTFGGQANFGANFKPTSFQLWSQN